MRASRVMTKTVECITPEVTLERAWKLMQTHQVRHLPVLWGDKVAGILSDRDLLALANRGVGGEFEFPPGTVADAMTTKPFTALATATVATLARLMLDAHIDSIPIVTKDDTLVGLVTSADLLELLTEPDQVSDVLPFSFALRKPSELMKG
ncbi:MAG: CBS domain-containing protein [Archangium sp.]|nr:CBS domain-containing protein [Archangium sp.]